VYTHVSTLGVNPNKNMTVKEKQEHCQYCNFQLSYTHNGNHYSHAVMVEVRGVYDGGLYFMCPNCRGTWHRWPVGHPLHDKAAAEMNADRLRQQVGQELTDGNRLDPRTL
jgi:hypothetical protein